MKFKNFDAMFSEMHGETVSFQIFGKMYSIKKQMPAWVVLEMARKEKTDSLTVEFMIKAARSIFGAKVMDEIAVQEGFTVDMLSQLIKWAFETINGKGDTTDDDDEMERMTEDDTNAFESKN